MNLKTITLVVVAIVAVGGVYFGVNRWRQQQLPNQILKEVGEVSTGLLKKLIGEGGNIQKQVAKEIAKEAAQEEAQQKADETKKAAKTPEDNYNETEEAATYDANSKTAANEAKDIMEKIFGKTKLTSITTTSYDSGNTTSSIMEFKIARLATGDDLGALNKLLTNKGLPIIQSSISDKTAMVMAGSNETTIYSFGFEIEGQTVGVNLIKTSP